MYLCKPDNWNTEIVSVIVKYNFNVKHFFSLIRARRMDFLYLITCIKYIVSYYICMSRYIISLTIMSILSHQINNRLSHFLKRTQESTFSFTCPACPAQSSFTKLLIVSSILILPLRWLFGFEIFVEQANMPSAGKVDAHTHTHTQTHTGTLTLIHMAHKHIHTHICVCVYRCADTHMHMRARYIQPTAIRGAAAGLEGSGNFTSIFKKLYFTGVMTPLSPFYALSLSFLSLFFIYLFIFTQQRVPILIRTNLALH